eukprot:scaffold26663_cov46-Attheya_sp.AAC.1
MSSPAEPDKDATEPLNESSEAVLSGDSGVSPTTLESIDELGRESIDELGKTSPVEGSLPSPPEAPSNALLSSPKPKRKKRGSSRQNLASLSTLPMLMPSFLDTIQESDDVERSDTSSIVDHSSTLGSSVVSSGVGGTSLSDVRNTNFKRWWHVIGNAHPHALSERSDLDSTGAGLEFGSISGSITAGSDVHPTSSTKDEVSEAMGVDKGVPVTAARPPQQRHMEERVVAFCMGYRNIIMFALLCITILVASLMVTTSKSHKDSKRDGAVFDTVGDHTNLRNPTVAPTTTQFGVVITEGPVTMPPTLAPTTRRPIGEGETYEPTVVTRWPTLAPTSNPKPTQSPTNTMPSPFPTVAPETTEQKAAMLDFLDGISADAFTDQDSAASRARTWLLEEDTVTLKLTFNGDAGSTTTRVAQRFVLAVFYFSLNGNSWINKGRMLEQETPSIAWYHPESQVDVPVDLGIHRELIGASTGEPFLSGVHECEWEGINCRQASVTYADGDVVEEQVVSSVILPSRNLQGTLPGKEMELGLAYLKQLSIYNNRISGTIPSELMNNMRFLDWLDVGENHLTGQVPAIGPKMRFLYLSSNRLSGEIAPIQATNEEYKLTHLWMQENMLSGSIPASLANLVNLGKCVCVCV